MNITQKVRSMADEIEKLSIEVSQAKQNVDEDEIEDVQEFSNHLFSVQSFIRYYYLPMLRSIFGEEENM